MQKWTKLNPETECITLVLCDQFSNLCLANCLEPLRAANSLSGRECFRWQLVTLDGAPVQTSSGIEIIPHARLSDVKDCDYLFLLTSYDLDKHNSQSMRAALRNVARQARVMVGFDAGPWLLAAAGLLERRRATIHWDMLGAFMEQFPTVQAERARVIRDGPRWTCAGAMSALDLVLELIRDHGGLSLRLDVEAMFIHDSNSPQSGISATVSDPLVQRALNIMRSNIENPLSIVEVAHLLSCQSRTLDRRFRRVLGTSPGQIYQHLRLSAARQMCENTALSVADIAMRTGYETPAAFTRAMRQRYGATPRLLRNTST